MPGINTVDNLKIFKTVVEKGSFSAAGRELNISAAWAAKAVTKLEKHLGTSLLIRSTRSLKLNEAGLDCYNSANRIIEELQILEDRMRDKDSEISGPVRISIPNILAIHKMGPVLHSFQKLYPRVQLDVAVSDNFVDPINEGLDFVLRITSNLKDSELISRKICPIERVLCAAPAYLKETPIIKTIKDLEGHNCLIYDAFKSPPIWNLREDGELVNFQPVSQLRINNSYLIKSTLLEGTGIAFLPRIVVEKEIEMGDIVTITQAEDANPMQLYLLRPALKHLPNRVRVLIDHLVKSLV